MFGAIFRYMRAFGYFVTGNIDQARKTLSQNPYVVQATFDHIIEDKSKRIQQYKQAVAALIAQEEKKKSELKRQSEEVARLQQLRDGAAAMARKLVERHGGAVESVKADPEYTKCQAAFADFSSTLKEKEGRCAELETDIAEIQNTVAGHKTQLQSLLRELEQVKQEKHATVADMVSAREEREIADILSGISDDRTSKELQEMREMRQQAKAGAKVSRELAGLDAKRSEEEFLKYATESRAQDEFDKLIGLGKQSESPTSEPTRSKIPEA
jgi:chromosome segregation ATPase